MRKKDIDFYRKTYLSGKTPWPSLEPEPEFSRFLNMIKGEFGADPICLDMGCGEGRHIILLKEIFKNAKIFAFDILREPITTAIKRIKEKNLKKVFFLISDVFFIPLKNETFDIVLDFGLFHHVRKPDSKYYKRELKRILKPGGYFIVGVFSTKFKHYEGEVRKRDFIFHRGHYDRFFTPQQLQEEFDFFEKIEITEKGEGNNWFVYGIFRKNPVPDSP